MGDDPRKDNAMKKFLPVFIAVFALGCGHSLKGVAPTVVRLAAEDCVEIAKLHNNGQVETICATAGELSPLLDAILAARKGEKSIANDAGKD